MSPETVGMIGVAFIVGMIVGGILFISCGCVNNSVRRRLFKSDERRRALYDLVMLKEHKDSEGKTVYYEHMHPIVWKNARTAIND